MSFPIRVLLVAEDPAPARELEAARLEGRDGQVTVAVAGDAAVGTAQLAKGDFDLGAGVAATTRKFRPRRNPGAVGATVEG